MGRSARVVLGVWIASGAVACSSAQPETLGAPIGTAGSPGVVAPRAGSGGATSPIGAGVSGVGGARPPTAGAAPSATTAPTMPMMGLDLFATPACAAIQAEAPGMMLASGAAGQSAGAGTGATAGAAGSKTSGGAGGAGGAGGTGGAAGARALILAGAGGVSAASAAGTGGAGGVGASASSGAGGAAGANPGALAGRGAMAGGSAATASFDAVYEILFCETCSNSYCHGQAAGFQISDSRSEFYTALLGPDGTGAPTGDATSLGKCTGMKRVVPGDPEHSLLYLKVAQRPPCGDAMPPPGQDRMQSGFLNAREVDVIRNWILAGAKKN